MKILQSPALFRHFALCCAASLALAGCLGQENTGDKPLDATQAAHSRQLLAQYQAARAAGNWTGAEFLGDQVTSQFPGSPAATAVALTLPEARTHADALREAQRLRNLWDYQSVAVGKGQQRSASIASRTAPVDEGEVAPEPDAQLVLRDHPAWGKSAYLLLRQTHFSCGSPCAMQISFDDASPRPFAGKQADSGKGPALFIVDRPVFLAALEQARKLKIQLPKGSGHIPSLVFDVGGFDPGRFAKP